MTEITKINEDKFFPSAPSNLIEAMVLGPFFALLITALLPLTIPPFFVIASFALVYGMPSYLCLGVPVLLWVLRHFRPSASLFAITAFLVQLCITVITLVLPEMPALPLLETIRRHLEATASWGLYVAPVWAFCSGLIYTYLLPFARPPFSRFDRKKPQGTARES